MKPVRDGNVRYTDAEVRRLLRDLVQRAAESPGIVDACLLGSGEASAVPGTTIWRGGHVVVEKDDGSAIRVEALTDEVSPSFFRMFDLPTLSGRTFTNADDEGGPKVVLITDRWRAISSGPQAQSDDGFASALVTTRRSTKLSESYLAGGSIARRGLGRAHTSCPSGRRGFP